jgi:hypothetical protein
MGGGGYPPLLFQLEKGGGRPDEYLGLPKGDVTEETSVFQQHLQKTQAIEPNCKEPMPKIRNNYSQRRNCQSPNFHIHVSVSDLYSHARSAYSSAEKYVDRSWEYIHHRHMNVEIGTEAAQFPEKEHINGIFVAVHTGTKRE